VTDNTAAQVAFAEAANLPVLDDRGAELVAELHRLRLLVKDIQLQADEVEDALVDWMAERGLWSLETPQGAVQRHGGTKRSKWDHGAVLDALRRYAQENPHDPETGERDLAHATYKAITECAGIGYWRTGALKARGIDPDEYATKSEGRSTVVIR
jgi:hypothetical protein